VSDPADTGTAIPAVPDARYDGALVARPPVKRPTGRAAAALAVAAALASLSTGMAIISALGGGGTTSFTVDRWVSIAFATGAIFGPAALAALLGARALLRHRPWAPLLLLVVGTMVATAGLVILTLTVSKLIGGGGGAPYSEFHFIFDQSTDGALALVAVLAALYALTGTLEAAAGIMGRDAARRPQAAA